MYQHLDDNVVKNDPVSLDYLRLGEIRFGVGREGLLGVSRGSGGVSVPFWSRGRPPVQHPEFGCQRFFNTFDLFN